MNSNPAENTVIAKAETSNDQVSRTQSKNPRHHQPHAHRTHQWQCRASPLSSRARSTALTRTRTRRGRSTSGRRACTATCTPCRAAASCRQSSTSCSRACLQGKGGRRESVLCSVEAGRDGFTPSHNWPCVPSGSRGVATRCLSATLGCISTDLGTERRADVALAPKLGVQLDGLEPTHVVGREEHPADGRLLLVAAEGRAREQDPLEDDPVRVDRQQRAYMTGRAVAQRRGRGRRRETESGAPLATGRPASCGVARNASPSGRKASSGQGAYIAGA